MKRFLKVSFKIMIVIFILFLVLLPEKALEGAKKGLMLSSAVIIPTLFPFAVCTLCALKTDIFLFLRPIEPLFKKIFGLNTDMLSVMILSFIGGYPIGSALVNELYKQKKITKVSAHLMLCFCVNAGPAFIISAVGAALLNSKQLGYALLISHILSSLLIAFFCSYRLKSEKNMCNTELKTNISYGTVFINSVCEAANSVVKICAFVVFFSTVNSVVSSLSNSSNVLKYLLDSLEVTNAISKTDNINLIAFWLGFSGVCIWCQVISTTNECGINLITFIFSRVLHGILNFLFFNAYIHIFKINVQTLSNNKQITFSGKYGAFEVSLAVAVLIIFLLICLENKKHSRKLSEDLL